MEFQQNCPACGKVIFIDDAKSLECQVHPVCGGSMFVCFHCYKTLKLTLCVNCEQVVAIKEAKRCHFSKTYSDHYEEDSPEHVCKQCYETIKVKGTYSFESYNYCEKWYATYNGVIVFKLKRKDDL